MSPPLDDLYLTWLYSQIGSVKLKNPARTYWSLAKQLYSTEFVWFVPNDDNRIEDGRALRYEFLAAHQIEDPDPEWLYLGCSMLELLISLARVLTFEGDGEPRVWFFEMLRNLRLDHFKDDQPYNEQEVYDILNNVIWRQYRRDGRGGLFPLAHAHRDQRDVEIWYQLNAYLLEREEV